MPWRRVKIHVTASHQLVSMCRQPQRKSGSKQPRATEHLTEACGGSELAMKKGIFCGILM